MALRGVWQLKELSIKFSKTGGSSRGIREFLENDLTRFQEANPQLKIVTKEVAGHPNALGSYVNNKSVKVPLLNKDRRLITDLLERMRDRSAVRPLSKLYRWHTAKTKLPSVQGVWEPGFNHTLTDGPAALALKAERAAKAKPEPTYSVEVALPSKNGAAAAKA